MSQLTILGGKPLVEKKKWAKWLVSTETDVQLVAKITRSNRWSFDGPVEWEFAQKVMAYQGPFSATRSNSANG